MTLILPGRVFRPPSRRASRLPFSWDARDLSMTARSGQVGTFLRGSDATGVDSAGRIVRYVYGQPHWQWADLDGDGVRETPMLLMEPTSTNLVTSPDDLSAGAGWTTGSVTVTPNAATFAGRPFSRVVASPTAGFITRPTTAFSGGGLRAFSFMVRSNNGATGKDVFILYDDTATTAACSITATFNADGTISFVLNTGTAMVVESLADGVYRVMAMTLSLNAAHTFRVYASDIGGALGAGGVTDSYRSGFQVENFPFPTSLIVDPSGTRQQDQLTFPYNALPQTHTLYCNAVERSLGLTTRQLIMIGNNTGGISVLDRVSPAWLEQWAGPDGNNAAAVTTAEPAFNDRVEVCGSWSANGLTPVGGGAGKIEAAVNNGAIASGSSSVASRFPSSWLDQNIHFNGYNSLNIASYGYISARIAHAVQPLTAMRMAV